MQNLAVDSLYSVRGKTVLVTGGSSGIGFMMSSVFAAAGARVYISARKPNGLREAHSALAAYGEVHSIQSDLGTAEGAASLAEQYAAMEPALNVLINNAGISWGAPFESFPAKAWDSVMTVNVQAPFSVTQKLLPQLHAGASAADPARVINIGSVYAHTTEVMRAYSYTASKAAIHQLTRVMARELATHHITVNAIAPGLFPSKMTGFALRDEKMRNDLLAQIPLGRTGSPEDIGGLAMMLASRAGAYITGAVIPLDGGILIGH